MAADPTPDSTHAEARSPEAPERKAGGKGRKIAVVLAIVVGAGLGAGVAYSQFGVIDRTAQGLLGADNDTGGAKKPVKYGEFMQIEGLVVNPAGTGGVRYLMVSVGLEAADPAVLEEVTAKDVVVRDAVIGLLSAKTVETLADIGNRDGMKEEIRLTINGILGKGEIDRLYFTQFMLQ